MLIPTDMVKHRVQCQAAPLPAFNLLEFRHAKTDSGWELIFAYFTFYQRGLASGGMSLWAPSPVDNAAATSLVQSYLLFRCLSEYESMEAVFFFWSAVPDASNFSLSFLLSKLASTQDCYQSLTSYYNCSVSIPRHSCISNLDGKTLFLTKKCSGNTFR